MRQYKRPGMDGGQGYYTQVNKNSENGCIYCSKVATTREHIPSKAFLYEPFPENLPVVPACLDCNNSFSLDEQYVSYYLEVMKTYVYNNYVMDSKIETKLSSDTRIRERIKKQINIVDNKIHFKYEEDRLVNVMTKLAKGHAAYEIDHLNFDDEPKISYSFIFEMNEEKLQEFNDFPMMNKLPEVGSRIGQHILIATAENGDVFSFFEWVTVQENQYRYCVYINSEGFPFVKFCIGEILFCVAYWD